MSSSGVPVKRVDRTIWLFGLGYFIAYTPYLGLVKAMTSGRLPGVSSVDGLVILPSVIAGTVVMLPIFIALLGWWRYARIPSFSVIVSGFGTALIIAATTMAYTFRGVSILFALLLLRGGVLMIAPVVDLICKRRVRWFSSVALVITLAAVLLAIFGTNDHRLTLAAAANTGVYLLGYMLRLPMMTNCAKVEDKPATRCWFVEEMYVALIFLTVIPLAGAALGVDGLRRGLALMVSGSAAANIGFLIGVAYALLYMFGTLIYLDRRENTFCIPLNRCSSLIAGVAATFALHTWLDAPVPAWFELTGVGMIIIALMFLSPLHHIPEWAFAYLVQRMPSRRRAI